MSLQSPGQLVVACICAAHTADACSVLYTESLVASSGSRQKNYTLAFVCCQVGLPSALAGAA